MLRVSTVRRSTVYDPVLLSFSEFQRQVPFPAGSIEALLYAKNWIDVAQWHMEDLIRDPQIDPAEGMKLKRRIDASNQDRTDRVEDLDTYFRDLYKVDASCGEGRGDIRVNRVCDMIVGGGAVEDHVATVGEPLCRHRQILFILVHLFLVLKSI